MADQQTSVHTFVAGGQRGDYCKAAVDTPTGRLLCGLGPLHTVHAQPGEIVARTAEDLEGIGDRWLIPIIKAALAHGWSFDVRAPQHGHRDVTFMRGQHTIRIRGLRRAANLSRWVVDGVDTVGLQLINAPEALADPDRFLHHDDATDGAA